MGLNNFDIAHRWVHNNLGKNGELKGSSTHCDELSFYSYDTVIAQALDRKENLFLVIDECLSKPTSKHIGYVRGAIPRDWNVIATHWEGGDWDNVHFLHDEDFGPKKRIELVSHLLFVQFNILKEASTSRKASATNIDLRPISCILKLESLYKGCGLNGWLRKSKKEKWTSELRNEYDHVVKMAKILSCFKFTPCTWSCSCDTENWRETVMDGLFGDGAWNKMLERTKSIDKAAETRARLENIANYLCLELPVPFKGGGDITCAELRKLLKTKDGKKELLRRKKASVVEEAEQYEEKMSTVRLLKSYNRSRKFLGMYPTKPYDPRSMSVITYETNKAVDMVEKPGECTNLVLYSHYESSTLKALGSRYAPFLEFPQYHGIHSSDYMYFNNEEIFYRIDQEYDSFCNAPDKKVWRDHFWRIAKIKARRFRGRMLWYIINHKDMPNDPSLKITLSDEDNLILNEYITRMNKYKDDKEAREEAERKEEERRKMEREQKIAEYKLMGNEGLRRIWKEGYGSLPAVRSGDELFYGGNVLFRIMHGRVETSKGIRMSFEECHRYYRIIKAMRESGRFKKGLIMAGYKVDSFDNDILIAGCHEMAWKEIESAYQEMCNYEAKHRKTA